MKETKIEWCDHSWSPWRGCTKVSPGCANCYAEGLAARFNRKDSTTPTWGGWGKGAPRVLAKNWGDPVKWNKSMVCRKCGFTEPLESKKPHGSKDGSGWCSQVDGEKTVTQSFRRPTVFPSLCDWLDDEVTMEWVLEFFKLIHDTPNLTWLILTKRPEKWAERLQTALVHSLYLPASKSAQLRDWCFAWINGTPPNNVWVGTSVEDQQRADERIPALLRIPAAGRFLSIEPMLGPVDPTNVKEAHDDVVDALRGYAFHDAIDHVKQPGRIDWVIVGGESGPGSRPCNVEWVRSVLRRCVAASVPCFVKQLGARPVEDIHDQRGGNIGFGRIDGVAHPKGGDPAEWPEDLRVRQFPEGLR